MKIILLFAALIWSTLSFSSSQLEISDPMIKMPPPGLTVSAIFLKIINNSQKDLKLIKVSGDFAAQFELHTMEMKDNMMKMRQVESIMVKKGATVELKSGGLHIMVFDIKKPLVLGKKYNLKLFFDDKSTREIKVTSFEAN